MKAVHPFQRLIAIMLCIFPVLFFAHCDSGVPGTAGDPAFPLSIKGSTVVIAPDIGKSDLATKLKTATGEEPSLVTTERI